MPGIQKLAEVALGVAPRTLMNRRYPLYLLLTARLRDVLLRDICDSDVFRVTRLAPLISAKTFTA